MIKIVIGILLVLGGLLSLVSDIGIIWTGGFIVGISLIASGIKQMEKGNQLKEEVDKIKQNWEDLLSRLEKEQNIDDIAADYHREHFIPPIRTIIVAAHLIKTLAESGDENALMLAAYISSKQFVDSHISPQETIQKFSFVDQVYFVDHEVAFYSPPKEDEEKPQRIEGTLILSKGYLFFFQNKVSFGTDEFMDAFDKARGLHPILAIVSDGYSLVSGLSKELDDYFTSERKLAYADRFAEEHSFAIPLVDINGLGHVEDKGRFLSNALLQIDVNHEGSEEDIQYLVANKSGSRGWVKQWWERIQLACIGESKLLIQIPKPILETSNASGEDA